MTKYIDCQHCGQDLRLPPLTLEEYTALLAVKRAGNALEIAGRNRGYGELPLMDLWLKLRDAIASLSENLK